MIDYPIFDHIFNINEIIIFFIVQYIKVAYFIRQENIKLYFITFL